MSRIPNCRVEGPYNENNLKGDCLAAIRGYDMAVEEIDTLFDNLDVYPDVELILNHDTAIVNKDKGQIIRDAIADWLEMKRNEMITAFIENTEEGGEQA